MGRRQEVLRDLRESVRNAVPWSLTFAPHRNALTPEQRAELEKYLKEHFESWAATWITPSLDEIEAILCGKKGDRR